MLCLRPGPVVFLLVAVAGASVGARRAEGQATPAAAAEDDATKAKAYYQQGMNDFTLGEYDRAIDKWKEGFRIKPVPEFLYNIGQAYRLSKNAERAVFFYKKYLGVAPKAANRGEVEKHIAALERLQKEEVRATTQPPVGTATPRAGVASAPPPAAWPAPSSGGPPSPGSAAAPPPPAGTSSGPVPVVRAGPNPPAPGGAAPGGTHSGARAAAPASAGAATASAGAATAPAAAAPGPTSPSSAGVDLAASAPPPAGQGTEGGGGHKVLIIGGAVAAVVVLGVLGALLLSGTDKGPSRFPEVRFP